MTERTYTVYKHTSPSNKVYIGVTCKSIKRRWCGGNGYKNNLHFWNAIQKYGWNNFTHEILYTGLTKEDALRKEEELIAQYKSNLTQYGYNRSCGGDTGGYGYHFHHTEALKQRYREERLGVPLSESHRQALIDAWKIRKLSNKGIPWNKGLHLKDSGKIDNFLQAGLQNIENRKRVIQQIDLETNEVINEYDSITEAAKSLGKNYVSSIIETARGRRKSAFGFGWRYK